MERYDPHEIEPKWQQVWEAERAFETPNPAPGAPYPQGGGTFGDMRCFPLPAIERNNNPNIGS